MTTQWALFVLTALLSVAKADNGTLSDLPGYNGTDGSFPYDPILQYRPPFACSLPVQIFMTGIVFTLTSVLLIHLLFTAQYHWPLAPVNYALQMSAVCTLLTSLIATLHVILNVAAAESRQWPYMLNYIAVDIPPLQPYTTGWSSGELAAWLLMNATTSALIQITHIQFLTLLFPSTLERRLIFILLGPLAIVAAIMQLVPLNDSTTDGKLTDIATAVQNVCNATLSLLFTGSLFIWGFAVNRKQAWRTDGGTAAFGVGAIMLALASTTITFIYIPSKDHYAWMPGLMWAVILWQSFLGWWWWVGAGMGVGEVDELLKREEKRLRKRKAKIARKEMRRNKAQTMWKDVASALGYKTQRRASHSRTSSGEQESSSASEGIRSSNEERSRPPRPRRRTEPPKSTALHATSSITPSSTGTATSTSATATGFFGQVRSHVVVRCVYGWYLLLRHAHLIAAREQAVENGERMQQIFGREGQDNAVAVDDPAYVGWGLGSYGLRQMENHERDRDVEAEQGILGADSLGARRDDASTVGEPEKTLQESPVVPTLPPQNTDTPDDPRARRRRNHRARRGTDDIQEDGQGQPSSMWYWGPLRRWRLQDATEYT